MSTLTRALRKFGEVTVMADKIGVEDRFWSALAHNQTAFEIIAGIPVYLSVMQEKNLRLFSLVVDNTVSLREWIDSLDPGCTSLLDIKPSWEIFGFPKKSSLLPNQRETIENDIYEAFQKMLFSQISLMGISIYELTTVPNSVLVEENNTVIFRPNSLEITVDHLIKDIKTIIFQRKFIVDMLEKG